jgi:hypothetical protein
MPGSRKCASIYSTTEMKEAFKRYWKSDSAFSTFSEATKDKYLEQLSDAFGQSYPTTLLAEEPLLSDDFRADADLALDNDIHPLFRRANFITELPLQEVRDILNLAFQLASRFITDSHALEWFAHVRFARRAIGGQPGMLFPRAMPISSKDINFVKKELRDLVGEIPISFFSHTREHDARCTCVFRYEVLDLLGAPKVEIAQAKQGLWSQRPEPMIFVSSEQFHQAMWHHYYKTSPGQQRNF